MQPVTPTDSKGSNGRLEQATKATEGMTRTFISSLETRYEVEVPNGQLGLSGHYRQYQRDNQSAIVQATENVLWRDPGPHRWNLRSKWGYEVWMTKSVTVDSHVIGTCFLVRSVRRRPSRASHQTQVFLSLRDTPSRLTYGRSAEAPQGFVKIPPAPVEAREENSQHVEAVTPTRFEEVCRK